ncbi:MAG: hypothetical protein V1792_05890 [Pseudomonadota bacterium]
METMNLLDITIKYFNVIVFVMCVLFGMTSLFASWVAWREIHRKRNIIRSVIAAYNIAEDTLENGRTPGGELQIDPAMVQTVFNSLQEVLNAIYGEVTGKPMPPREDRTHGSRRIAGVKAIGRVFRKKGGDEAFNADRAVPQLIPEEREHHQYMSNP